MKVAQFRYDSATEKWTLYRADRNERWHEYWDLDPDKNLDTLLREVDEDPTRIFGAKGVAPGQEFAGKRSRR